MLLSNHLRSKRRRGVIRPSFLSCFLVLVFFLCAAFSSTAFAKISFDDDFLDGIERDYGDYPRRRLVGWQKLIEENQELDEKQKLEKVNTFLIY